MERKEDRMCVCVIWIKLNYFNILNDINRDWCEEVF